MELGALLEIGEELLVSGESDCPGAGVGKHVIV